MIDQLKNISMYITISIILTLLSILLKSSYISSFLDTNLVLIIIALMAINTTTTSIIMTKLREIAEQYGNDFNTTMHEMRKSVCEQVWLLITSFLLFILKHSIVVQENVPYYNFIFDVLILSIFCFAVHILYDTADAAFIILKFESKQDDHD